MRMNHYGEMAREHWARMRPKELATIEDPDRFFTELGRQIEDRIVSLALELEQDTGTDDYLANAAMMHTARRMAEDQVIREMFGEPTG
jgi:hypothetical protein